MMNVISEHCNHTVTIVTDAIFYVPGLVLPVLQ